MKRIVLIDCNNFFVSCERVFNSKLIGKPVVVLSNNDGCVISRSNEAKALGIPMGAAAFEYQHILKKHNVQVFSSNFTLYGDMSARVMDTLSEFSTDIEVYSIDEAFLCIPACPIPARLVLAEQHVPTNFEQSKELQDKFYMHYCKFIKSEVKQRTGIPISIGIAPTKTLAKVANKIAKKSTDGVFDITDNPRIDDLLASFDVSDVWGVGYRYAKLLKSKNINTARDLKYAPLDWVRKNMTINGLKTALELQGKRCIMLNSETDPKKSITVSRSFSRYVTAKSELKEAVCAYMIRAAQKLRENNCLASVVTVFVATSRYHEHQRYFNSFSIELDLATDFTPELIAAADKCLDKIYKSGFMYKKAGVLLSNFVPNDQLQTNLCTQLPNKTKQKALMNVCDKISLRWGSDLISFACAGIDQSWKAKRLKKSQNFTTNWNELLTIKI